MLNYYKNLSKQNHFTVFKQRGRFKLISPAPKARENRSLHRSSFQASQTARGRAAAAAAAAAGGGGGNKSSRRK